MKVCLFDPSIRETEQNDNHNLGDLIIRKAVQEELAFLLHGAEVMRVSTQVPMDWRQVLQANLCGLRIACGTNLLASHWKKYTAWKITPKQAFWLRRLTLLGVGWWSDQDAPDAFSRKMYGRLLSRRGWHSVRDGQALRQLQAAGFTNVLNTGCPTMWKLHGWKSGAQRTTKGSGVITMVSAWRKEPELDRALFALLRKNYGRVWLWPQGPKDVPYLQDLGLMEGVQLVDRSMAAFERFCAGNAGVDYVGLRLHGGIACLKAGLRSLIIEVDNRAREIGRDTGLPTIARDQIEGIAAWIERGGDHSISLPVESIGKWKAQFSAR